MTVASENSGMRARAKATDRPSGENLGDDPIGKGEPWHAADRRHPLE